jgi:hypothetical protein
MNAKTLRSQAPQNTPLVHRLCLETHCFGGSASLKCEKNNTIAVLLSKQRMETIIHAQPKTASDIAVTDFGMRASDHHPQEGGAREW